jgi:hypothetical protein
MKKATSLLIFLCATAALVFAGDIKTVVVPGSKFPSGFTLDIPAHHYVRIHNFIQDGVSSPRGVVIASAETPTPTPTPTATPTCSPTPCTPTPTPATTPTPTATPTPTPTPPPRAVLNAAFVDPSATPEFIKQVVVDGPAQISVSPIPNAKLVLTYQRVLEPTPTPTP